MKKYFTLLLFTLLFFSSDIYSQWYRQYIDANITIEDVRFIDKNTGWLCGADLIYKTTNGGKNWINQPNQTNRRIEQIHPVDEKVIYACGSHVILKTEDGGENWITLREGTNLVPLLNGLWFYNKNTGWFCGDGVVIKTIDGCNTFVDSMAIGGLNHDIYFRDSITGLICGSIDGNILRTTNSGRNWYTVPLPITQFSPYIYRESFVKESGWLASSGNIVYKTTNFGQSWDSISKIPRHPSFGQTFCIAFGNNLTGYTGGDSGKIHKSTNGGYSWIEQNTSSFGVYGFLSIYAHNDSIVWAVGGGGKILYTENGGGLIVGNNETHTLLPKSCVLYQNYPNPFNPKTTIKYELFESSFVSLKLYDISGNELKTFSNKFHNPGMFEIIFDGVGYSSGIYIYKIIVGQYEESRIMLLLK